MAGDGVGSSVLSREEYDSLVLRLKEVEIERNKLSRALRAAEKRYDVLRINLETISGLAEAVTNEKMTQERYTRLLLHVCPDIIMVFDGDMKFLLGTDSIRNIIAVDDILLLQGRSLHAIVDRYAPPAFTPEMLDAIEMMAGHGPDDALDFVPEKNLEVRAGEINYDVRILSFHREDDIFAGFLIVMHDVTDLISAREQAQQASRSKGEFLSRMSHEIRTPMNAIIGMTSIAQKTENTAKKNHCLGKIDRASTHLLGVINDILDMAKIEAGKLDITPHAFHFENMLKNAADVLQFRMDEKKQKFIVSLDERIPQIVIGDDLRLTQVLTNLLSNAVKFTPDGGTVTLAAQCLEDTGTAFRLLINITDTGVGISEEQQARLFTAFEQAERVTVRKFGGTGLGLAISKHIVELMGGNLWVKSKLGQGAAFAFTVTLQKGGDAAAQLATALKEIEIAPFADYAGNSILIAEDVEINREIISELLAGMNLHIDFAVNGEKAVQMFKDSPGKYQMILMDVQMPDMDGYEATRIIRSLPCPEAAVMPIIAMTANVFREDVDACLAVGMNAHLGKPIEVGEMQKVFRKYLARR